MIVLNSFRCCATDAFSLRVRLQMAITSSFQLQFAHRLKRWTPDFPSFEMRYSIHNLSSWKCSKMCPTVAKWGCGCNISAHGLRGYFQMPITSLFQLQIVYRLKRWTLDFSKFETKYGMHEMDFRKYFKMCPTVSTWGVRLRHFRSWFARSSSNGHNFFVSTPIRTPFETLDS